MAKIDQNVMKQWQDGETIHAVEYNNERNLIVSAHNDTQAQVDAIKGSGGVTTPMIRDGAVTMPKLANGAVIGSKIASGAVTEDKLADMSVTPNKLGAGAITSERLANGAVTPTKIQKESVTQYTYDREEIDQRIAAGITGNIPQSVIDEISQDVVGTFGDRFNEYAEDEVSLSPGVSIVTSERDAIFKLGNMFGTSIPNILPLEIGDCESLLAWTVRSLNTDVSNDTTIKYSGTKSLKLTATGTVDEMYAQAPISSSALPVGNYIVTGYVYLPDLGFTNTKLSIYAGSFGTTPLAQALGGTSTRMKFFPIVLKMPKSAMTSPTMLHVRVSGISPGGSNPAINFDNIRVYQVDDAFFSYISSITNAEEAVKAINFAAIRGTDNPYAIATSDNLLPPFYEWDVIHANATIVNPYELKHVTKTTSNEYNYCIIPVAENVYYSLTVNNQGVENRNLLQALDSNFQQLTIVESGGSEVVTGNGTFTRWVKTPANTKYLRIYFYPIAQAGTTGVFSEPRLALGKEATPFKPQRKSMLAFQTELHANPVDGSNPDVLFEREGQYFKLAKWRSVTLDGSHDWGFRQAIGPGWKTVRLPAGYIATYNPALKYVTSYDGRLLPITGPSQYVEGFDFADDGYLRINLPNTLTGWGDDYTPTADEIKAYFMGWKMQPYAGTRLDQYTGTGEKAWYPISRIYDSYDASYQVRGTAPTTPANNYDTWKPYQLLYRLAKEVVEPVSFEGALVLPEGKSVVEVGTGIVLREAVAPVVVTYSGSGEFAYAYVNRTVYPNGLLKNKTRRIDKVYKNGYDNTFLWTKISDGEAYGVERVTFGNVTKDYDQSATYSVTYIKLDKSPIQPITGTLAANEKSQISDLTAGVAEALQRVSVVEQKKAEKDAPGWITPTLLNGWVNYGGSDPTVGYLKDEFGFVHLKGTIKGGTVSPGTMLFNLPKGFRPKENLGFSTISSSGTIQATRVFVSPEGFVRIFDASNTFLYLQNISFLAEQ